MGETFIHEVQKVGRGNGMGWTPPICWVAHSQTPWEIMLESTLGFVGHPYFMIFKWMRKHIFVHMTIQLYSFRTFDDASIQKHVASFSV